MQYTAALITNTDKNKRERQTYIKRVVIKPILRGLMTTRFVPESEQFLRDSFTDVVGNVQRYHADRWLCICLNCFIMSLNTDVEKHFHLA